MVKYHHVNLEFSVILAKFSHVERCANYYGDH